MTVRGQRLFVRPIDSADGEEVRAFLRRHSTSTDAPSAGLVGKLVGDLVAVLAMQVTDDAIRIEDLVVAHELRRKQIGRVMLGELAELALKMERDWLIVDNAGEAREFFRRAGFEDEGTTMKRRVR
jgi:ribosomal protein S18 acetylase RimI-like enzyme